MSIKKLFDNNKQAITVGKYLKKTSPDSIGEGVESEDHLDELVERQKYFLPPVDYSDPENFVRFGSAKEYYTNAFQYIANYYPYDGSGFEKTKFYNEINPVEKYILEEAYPRSTGFVSIGTDYGSFTPHASGYYSSSAEYIQTKGGPHATNVYNESKNRTSNLNFGGDNGTTVEFFYKKETNIDATVESPRQVVFDLWNGTASGSAGYGRLRIEVATGSADHFEITMLSGTTGFYNLSIPTGSFSLNDNVWRNYGFVFNTSLADPTIDFYVNGECLSTGLTGSSGTISEVTGTLISNLGALRTAPSGTSGVGEGYGKLSGSLDEFRFWKSVRNSEEIGRYWFDHVNGGSNLYDANVSLGVYYKFNEGITGNDNIDNVVLDYSGRISNGSYIGYDSSTSRNTGSAIDQLSIDSVFETGDPIVRTTNPTYISVKEAYELTGSNYDAGNNARMINHLPAWIIEEEEEGGNELSKVTQIMSTYFDTLYNQIEGLKNSRSVDYISGSATASINSFPYNDRLIQNLGIDTPELFANIDALAQFQDRGEQINFDNRLEDVKNLLYKNIYNNLVYILKSKGTEKSIRNFVRCLGVGEEIIALNTYADNTDYDLTSSYTTTISSKKYADFTGLLNASDDKATLYQYYDSSNTNSVGLISGSTDLEEFAFSLQTECIFPDKQNYQFLDYDLPTVISSSLFGFHTPDDTSPTSTDLTWASAANDYGLQVYAVKSPAEYADVYSPLRHVKDAYFVVKNRAGDTLLSSSIYKNVYENKKWNFTLSLRPANYPFADGVTGASVATHGYTLELYGVNYEAGVKQHSFTETADLTNASGSVIVESAKRVYAGAHRTNYTGSVLTSTDIKASSIRYWTDYLPSETLNLQAKTTDAFGRNNPYENAYSYQTKAPSVYIPKAQTLALNWDLANVTGSDASGRFTITDYSSGSSGTSYPATYQDTLSNINLRQHTGRGDFFEENFTPVRKGYVYTEQLQPPEYAADDNMVRVLSSDEETFGIYTRPQSFFFAVERSMYRGISNRILEMFASIKEFNTYIGNPVNKYRLEYKKLEKLREIFFRSVQNDIPSLDKYIDYYKWLDSAVGTMIEQLLPASARYAKNTRKIVESHVLERSKVKYQASIIRSRRPGRDDGQRFGPGGSIGGDQPGITLEGDPRDAGQYPPIVPPGTLPDVLPVLNVSGVIPPIRQPLPAPPPGALSRGAGLRRGLRPNPITSAWRYNHHPVDGDESRSSFWWQHRAERYETALSSSGDVLYTRQSSKRALQRQDAPRTIRMLQADFPLDLAGGGNHAFNKKQNQLNFTFDRFESLRDINDDIVPDLKKRIPFRATFESVDYNGEQIAPFSVFQSTLTSGYNSVLIAGGLSGLTFTNLHNDKVHSSSRVGIPMQGLFTSQWVGGKQSRHVSALRTQDRKEEFSLSIAGGTGSFDRTGVGATPPGYYFRGLAAKSPVNISNISTVVNSHTNTDGIRKIGNYLKKYEVTQTSGRAINNMDFVANTANYNYSAPSAFITPPSRRTAGLTGSADYPAPRQIVSRRTNETIFVNRFSAPGGKLTSKQQFRDVNSDQFSPNNALPFRNLEVRKPYNKLLTAYVRQDGYSSYNNLPAPVKTQRNSRLRLEFGSTSPTETVVTGTMRDNAFVTHPIPTADRSQWTSYISGSDNLASYTPYVALGERYPANIYFTRQDPSVYSPSWTSLIVGLDGQKEFKWSDYRDFVPWKQLRSGQTNAGKYYNKNNVYELAPKIELTSGSPLVSSLHNFYNRSGNTIDTKTRTEYDRNGFAEPYYYSQRFREAPVTSRYKPIKHYIRTPIGTPSKTGAQKTMVNMEYSYGNELMGFANRELNYEIGGNVKFGYGKIKRPYEIIREKFVDNVSRQITGIDLLQMTSYKETIYPKEVYTFLSGSRARQVFRNSFWKNDKFVLSTDMSSFTDYSELSQSANIEAYNRQYPRLDGNFVTSQDSIVYLQDQNAVSTLDPLLGVTGRGSGSRWPLDSYIYSDSRDSLVTVLDGGKPVLLADAGIMAAGELMMTNYGRILDQATNSTYATTPISAYYATSKVNTAQYVYNVPVTHESCSSTPAVCATSYIDVLRYEQEPSSSNPGEIQVLAAPIPPAAATGSITFGTLAEGDQVGGFKFEIPDGTTTFDYQFDSTTGTTTFTSPSSYLIGVSGSIAYFTATEVRDALYDAIVDSTSGTPPTPLDIETPTKNGSYGIDLTAGTAGSAFNANTITWDGAGGSTGAAVAGFGGGADRDDNLSGTQIHLSSSLTYPGPEYLFTFTDSNDLVTSSSIGYATVSTINGLASRISASMEQAFLSASNTIRPDIDGASPDTVDLTQTTLSLPDFNMSLVTGSFLGATANAVTMFNASDISLFRYTYTKSALTLELNDVAHGAVTFTFNNSVNYNTTSSSPSWEIGTLAADSDAKIVASISSAITARQGAGDVNISVSSTGSSRVNLVADVCGTGMNGQEITGSAEDAGLIFGPAFSGGVAATYSCQELPEPRSPGSVYTRPPWTAGSGRKYVAGNSKGQSAGSSYPYYDTYEEYVEDIRRVGKDFTIVPEYRISEHAAQFETQVSLTSLVSASLELTGASSNIFNGSHDGFYERYTETDTMEFLENFMPADKQNRNYLFNKYPRHFEIQSDALLKILPYDGFYPVDRSLQVASLFRTAYEDHVEFTTETGSPSSQSNWRSILRPFFAPGILYNSIKSGVAVDYPIRRSGRNTTPNQYLSSSNTTPLHGCLSGTLTSVASGSIPGNSRRNNSTFDWDNTDVNAFFWADRLPFESILDPVSVLQTGSNLATVLSDINHTLYLDVTGSITETSPSDSLYKKSVSNFLANIPQFFLTQKENKFGEKGYLTKFVSQFGYPPKDSQQSTNSVRKISIEENSAYMMEVGLFKSNNFNMYSNPYAFGIPTATGSTDWGDLSASFLPALGSTQWPQHRAEFAPFTPPYYYGPSLVRMLFMPQGDKTEYTLEEILENNRGELFVQYLNENEPYYDMTSGSYIDRDNNVITSTATPSYGWNRAWQNRMDIDASISLFNRFPIDGGEYKSLDPNKWTIMPKWECPILDFPQTGSGNYNFSSSVDPGEYLSETQGMWHQYGVMPDDNEGVYLYLKDIPTGKNEEYDQISQTYATGSDTAFHTRYVKKIPKVVIDSNRQVRSLADLCGFDPNEIIRNGMDMSKAKRIGELGEDKEKTLSEAILALPYYLDDKNNTHLIPLRASATKLGPKIKEFRKQFTKFSLPPALAMKLLGLVPQSFPAIPDVINPFGDDDYDSILSGEEIISTPAVYLLEHKVTLTRQDLADMWQGITPHLGRNFTTSYAAIDHYLPGDNVEETSTKFPEVLKKQIELGVVRDGHPRYDIIDISEMPDKRGLFPEIKWLVFKVKERGLVDYSQMVMEEVDGPEALNYDNVRGYFSMQGLSSGQIDKVMGSRDEYAKNIYKLKQSLNGSSYNWPYDYFSMIELGKINTKVVFRPELETEYEEAQNSGQMEIRVQTPSDATEDPPASTAIFSAVSKIQDE